MRASEDFPYVMHEPKLGTFEYGSVKLVLGKQIKNRLGVCFSFERAVAELERRGFELNGKTCVVGTRPAAEKMGRA